MSHPLNSCNRPTLYCGGTGCQIIKMVVKKANSPRFFCKMVVKNVNFMRSLCNALVVGSVDGELRHRCGAAGRKIMYEDRWALRLRLLIKICNIATPPGEEGTIVL